MFTFPITMMSSGVDPSIGFTASAVDSVSRTAYTFSSQAFGDAHTTRQILVAAGGHRDNRGVSSITIGGVTASNVKTQGQGAGGTIALYIAAVPTGTSGDVVITWDGATGGGSSVAVWRLVGLSATATDTDGEGYAEGSATNFTLDVNVAAGGVAVAATVNGNSGGEPHTTVWSNITENYDTQVNSNEWQSGASILSASAASPLNIIGNPDSTPHRAGAACSFPPL